MAEESSDMLLSPEITKQGGGNIRRNSTGTPFVLSSGEKPVPHYLRASIGSCHDFCKYGRKHAFEAKARSPISKINITSRSPDAKNPVEKVVQAERKKATMVKLKPSPNTKAGFAQCPKIIKLEVSSPSKKVEVSLKHASANARGITDVSSTMKKVEVSSKQAPANARGITDVSSTMKKVEVSSKQAPANARGITDVSSTMKKVEVSPKQAPPNARGITQYAKHTTPVKLRPMTVKSSPSPDPLKGSSGRRNSDINIGQKTGTSKVAVKKVLVSPAARLSPKPSADVAILDARKNRSLDVVSPLKNQNRVRKDEPQQPKNNKIHGKTLRTTLFPKPSINRVASLNARKYKSLKVVSPLKNLNRTRKAESQQPDDDKVIEKILYVVKTDTDDKTLGSAQDGSPPIKLSPSPLLLSAESSSQPTSPSLSSQEEEDQEESEHTISDADDFILEDSETESMNEAENYEEEDNETENVNEAENSEGEYERMPQKAGMVHSEDKDRSAVKLNFRRGKVLDLNSQNKGPRRLRFRRGRLLEENQNVKNDAGRRSFKRRGVDGDTNGTKDESEKVVLRHQDVQGKKDAQGLLNNVIEETASKLVETRKSKVKALVGAFETVISLQETKPSTNTVT